MFGYGAQARLDWVNGTDHYALRVFRRREGGGVEAMQFAGVGSDGQPEFGSVDVEQNGIIPPLMLLPDEVVSSLRAQLAPPGNTAELVAHRDDAIMVRDRLLAIVESRSKPS